MIVINLFGGSGAGKTTLAYYLVSELKKAGFRAELVGEAAREMIYDHPAGVVPAPLRDNQLLVTGQQYERLLRLERHGIEIAVSDSPLILGTIYDKQFGIDLYNVIQKCQRLFPNTFNVFVQRTLGKYDPESRVQRTEAEAVALDEAALRACRPIWRNITWNQAKTLLGEIKKLGKELK